MESHGAADEESGEGSRDAPLEIWTRAQEAKKPAFILRLELLTYVEDTTTTKLDALLQGTDVSPEARTLVRRSLVGRRNAMVKKHGDQTMDFLVLLAAERGLSGAWRPDENEMRQTLPDVVRRACAYGTTAERAVRERVSGSRRTLRKLRVAVGPDAEERLQDTVLAELYFRGMDPNTLNADGRAKLAERAERELLCRQVVVDAAVRMSRRSDQVAEDAWADAANVVRNPFTLIVERGDVGPFTRGPAANLERLARLAAQTIFELDEGLFRAIVLFAVSRYARTLRTLTVKADILGRRERLPGGRGDAQDESPEGELDRLAQSQASRDTAPVPSGGSWAWLMKGARIMRGPMPLTERAVVVYDILALVEVCRIVTQDHPDTWLPKWYDAVSRTTATEGLASVWTLCQATRPHSVKWPGYSGRQSDRQRRFVADIGRALEELRATDEGEADVER